MKRKKSDGQKLLLMDVQVLPRLLRFPKARKPRHKHSPGGCRQPALHNRIARKMEGDHTGIAVFLSYIAYRHGAFPSEWSKRIPAGLDRVGSTDEGNRLSAWQIDGYGAVAISHCRMVLPVPLSE
jgi:hypothetical protein